MIEPLDLVPELQHEQRIKDLLLMRKTEKNHIYPVKLYEVKDVLAEMNIRFLEYHTKLSPVSNASIEFKVLQVVQDFQYLIQPLQVFKPKQSMIDRLAKAKVDYSLPVAQLDKKMIYFVEEFTFEKPKE